MLSAMYAEAVVAIQKQSKLRHFADVWLIAEGKHGNSVKDELARIHAVTMRGTKCQDVEFAETMMYAATLKTKIHSIQTITASPDSVASV